MTPSLKVLKETIKKLINKGNYTALERLLQKTHKGDIVAIFRYLSQSERLKVFEIIMKQNLEKASDILYDLDEDLQIEILRGLPEKSAIRVLLTFSSGEIAKLIDKLPDSIKKGVLEKLEDEERQELEKYISYGEDTIVHLISEEYLKINENKTVEDALNLVKASPQDEDIEIIYIYAVDDEDHLTGVVSLKELLVSPPNAQVKDIMVREPIYIRNNASKEEVIQLFKRYDLYLLPVVDEEEKLIGVIYIDDILDAIDEKTTEEVFKLAGSKEDELFYANQVFKIVKLRLPWLLTTVFGELLTAFIISLFDVTIQKAIPIIFFLPLVAAISGNISSQSAIITAQGFLTGKITDSTREFFRILLRELKIALIIGLIVSFIVGFISFIWLSNHILGVLVGIALFINIIVSAVLGGFLPFLLKLLKKDVALATTPLTLTLNDIIGITVYLSMATYFVKLFP